jgi:hypothetical protein
MVATIATEAEYLDESISTCRFALRVAMVSNTVSARTTQLGSLGLMVFRVLGFCNGVLGFSGFTGLRGF